MLKELLARLIPANFTDKDYKFELTYAPQNNPADLERAKKDFANFVKRVNRDKSQERLTENEIYLFH